MMVELISPVVEGTPSVCAANTDADYLAACRRLTRKFPSLRVTAVGELAEYGARAIPHLVHALNDEAPTVRVASCEALGRVGTDDVIDPLSSALKSNDDLTRAAAARALGEIGDVRAIRELTEALRECLANQTAKSQRALGLALLPIILGIYVLVFFIGNATAQIALLLLAQGAWISWCIYTSERRVQSRVCAAITEAIGKIAAMNPSPEFRRLMPELRAIAGDLMLQERGTRKAARRATQQIEQHTSQWRDLPMAAAPPIGNPNTLPIATESAESDSLS